MRVLKRFISYTIWSLLALYIVTLVLVNVPPVQTWLGDRVADAIAAKFNTKVTVGRVNLGFLNRLTIDDVLVLDQSGEPLLGADRLSVKIELLPLLEGRIAIATAQLFGAAIHLSKADDATPANYQFVLDALVSADSTDNSPLDLRVGSLILRRGSISYDRGDVTATPGQLNVNHLAVGDISAHVILKALTPDSLNVNLKRLACSEQSGLTISHLTARLEANRQGAVLKGFCLQLPHSSLLADSIEMSYDADNLAKTLNYDGSIYGTTIMPADFAALLPALKTLCQQIAVDAAFTGTAKTVGCPRFSVVADDGSLSLSASAWLDATDSIPSWYAKITDLIVTDALTAQLKQAFPSIPDEMVRLGNISLTATAMQSHDGQVEANADANTTLGDVQLSLNLMANRQLDAHLFTDNLHLGRLLANDELGTLVTTIDLGGTPQHIKVVGNVDRIEWNDYPYTQMQLDGTYEPATGIVAGHLLVDDPNLQADVEGALTNIITKGRPVAGVTTGNRRGKHNEKAVRMTGYVRRVSPKALHLSDRWGDAKFSAVVDADVSASCLDDAHGSLDIDDFVMATEGDSVLYRLDNLHVKSHFDDEGRHFLRITGDMGEVDMAEGEHNYVRLQLNDTHWMQQLLDIPLQLHAPLRVTATIDDQYKQVDMSGSLPSFTYAGTRYNDLRLKLNTEDDTIRCSAALTMQMKHGGEMKLDLNADTELLKNEEGGTEAHVHVKPSQMMLKGTPWQLKPCNIHYSDQRIEVDSFSLAHDNHHLIIDGVVSANHADTLIVDLNDMEVDYILDLVNFHAVKFDGMATGKAYATQLFGDFAAWADLVVADFRFLDGEMGTLHAKANWNRDDKQIDIDATVFDSPNRVKTLTAPWPDASPHTNPLQAPWQSATLRVDSVFVQWPNTHVAGYISPVRSDISLDIRALGTSVDFCRSFTGSFLSNLKGKAEGRLRVAGPLKHINLTGQAAVTGEATVTALGTTYQLRGDTIRFVPNDIVLDRFPIYDRDGHRATLSGGIHHDELSDFTFDLDVSADRLLAYDFPDFNGSIVCGTVYATGTTDLHGRPGEVVINCNVTPQPSSFFAYNAANPDTISTQEFITWGSPVEMSNEKLVMRNENEGMNNGTDIHINFLINATPEASLRVLMDQGTGDYITLNGNGTISATFYNKGPFSMFGTYNVEGGSYGITIQNIIKKNFTFQPGGTIVFGGDPFNANLNLQALYTVNGVSLSDLNLGTSFANNTVRVNCLMNIMGTPGQPRVEFDLDMPTVNSEENQMIRSVIASEQEMNQQVLYLLGIGRFYTQGVNNASTQQYDQTTLAMQSFLSGTVSTQINEVLSQVIKSNDWNFGANISTGNEGWHNAEYEGLVSGRMLNNRLLINGQFGYRDNATQATPSFIGDFDIRYLLDRNGNFAVKVYNQSNDRYFTRSSLNTQGVGLIMKRDFDGLSDLFHWRKQRK